MASVALRRARRRVRLLIALGALLAGLGREVPQVQETFQVIAGDRATAPALALTAVLLAPAGEELLFRGALFGWLRRRLHAAATITVTAMLFAAIHMMPALLPLTFIFGLGFGWIRERTGSTTPAFVMHVVNNVALIAGAYLVAGWNVGPLASS